MKKLLIACCALFAVVGCERNLEDDNSPGLQGVRNGEFYKSTTMAAFTNDDGSVIITGARDNQTVQFTLSSGNRGTYVFGQGSENEAVFSFNEGTLSYSSNEHEGRGELVIESGPVDSFVTGTFDFVGYLEDRSDSLYMRRGFIFEVPYIENPGGAVDLTESFAADVDGNALNPDTITVTPIVGAIKIAGAQTGGATIELQVPDDVVVGVYPMDNFFYSGDYIVGPNSDEASRGSIEITEHDTVTRRLVGTFEFATLGGVVITNGEFSVTY